MALIISNAYLSQSQMTDNAQYIADYLINKGWTRNAIAGILGNMQRESTLNPGLWESLIYGNMSGGYGLVQWTPATDYTSWADARRYPWGNNYGNTTAYFNGQLECILWEVANNQHWIATSSFNFSFSAFTKSTQSPEYLAEAFMRNYERPGVLALEERRQNARYWFENLTYGSSTVIKNAVEWAVAIANDNSHGYSQDNRWGPDYDCSSLLISAWQQAGVPVKDKGASYTGNMYDAFIACGFQDVTNSVDMASGSGIIYGDVLLNHVNHTAMSIGNGRMVQASSNRGNPQTGDQDGTEIWTCGYYNYPWNCVLRYPGGSTPPTPTGVSLVRWIPG